MQLASRFGHVNQIRRERPLTREELMYHVPSIFGEDRTPPAVNGMRNIPTITVLENLQREGFQPFFACQTRVRDPEPPGIYQTYAASAAGRTDNRSACT
ncbi:CP4-57 prophage protein [Escherichia coli]|uniref:CP4-57 prophage protein n=1 Tax=Escherichia coli TaxID=562 RepID=A0A376LFZ7_ECOLX|nr:CP4-57 prophage protein [Escherichia coli]